MAYKIGVVGLGVMGANLARNIESKGFPVAAYELDATRARAFLEGPARGRAMTVADTPQHLYDAYRSQRLPANLTQAQRDYFGAHTYRRLDREGVFHTEWGTAGGRQ